jgi:epidermal growth factor receptor substrate 15
LQKFKKEILLLFVFFTVLSKSSIWAQKDGPLKKKADLEFDNKDFRTALTDYRQLLTQDQKNTELNFKYATCIYFTEDIKNAKKYYDLILNKPDVPAEVFYYRAKIYQHQYDFQNAIKLFEKYKSISGKKPTISGVDNEINYCKNALANLKVPGSIKTLKREAANLSDFYNTYSFTNISYSFYPAKEVFTKFNEKNNFIPVNALVRGMKYRFLSSYSSDLASKKDIFIQKKNEKNDWDEPIRLSAIINSTADEDFPFYDETNEILYFSSNGHNSIGGYDIFKVKFDLGKIQASELENLNFPFSTPNDDLFLVPDQGTKNAYFASNRNGILNKVEVFQIELTDEPIQMIFLSGKLSDKIDEQNKNVQITVLNSQSKESFGPFYSDENGNYLIGVPKEGSYIFKVSITGASKEFSEIVEIPKISNSKKIEQELVYSMINSSENLEVINRVINAVPNEEGLEILKLTQLAKLDINIATLKTENKTEEKESVFKELGYFEKDSVQLLEKFTDDLLDVELDIEKNIKYEEELISKIESNDTQIIELDSKIAEIKSELESNQGDDIKNKLKSEQNELEKEKLTLVKQNFVLQQEIESIEQSQIINHEGYSILKTLNKTINESVLNNNFNSTEQFITANKEKLKPYLDLNLGNQEVIQQDKQKRIEIEKNTLTKSISEYSNQISTLSSDISQNENKLTLEKNKKEQTRIQNEITQQKKNLSVIQDLKLESDYQLQKILTTENIYSENKSVLAELDRKAEDKKEISSTTIKYKAKVESSNLISSIIEKETEINQSFSKSADDNYENDIANLEKITNPVERNAKLSERENKHLSELKKSLEVSISEDEKAKLNEEIQLSQNRLNEFNSNSTIAQENKEKQNSSETKVETNEGNTELTQNPSENPVNKEKQNSSETKVESNAGNTELTENPSENLVNKEKQNSSETQVKSNEGNNELTQNPSENPVNKEKQNSSETKVESNAGNTELTQNQSENSVNKEKQNSSETKVETNEGNNELTENPLGNSVNKEKQNSSETKVESKAGNNELTQNPLENSVNKEKQNSSESKVETNEGNTELTENPLGNSVNKEKQNSSETKVESNAGNTELTQNPSENLVNKEKQNSSETKVESNAGNTELTENPSENSVNKEKQNSTETKVETNEGNTELTENPSEKLVNKEKQNSSETKVESNAGNTELTENPSENSVNKEKQNSTEIQVKSNEVNNESIESTNETLRPEDLKQAVLYNLNATKIDQEIILKKKELMNVKSDIEREKLLNEIAQLEKDTKNEYNRSLQNERIARFKQQFPELDLISNYELIAELNEIKLRDVELQQKINQSNSDVIKVNLKEQRKQLVALKTELESKLNDSIQKIYYEPNFPMKESNVLIENQKQLRSDEIYIKYISERQKFNQIVEEFELVKNRNKELRNELLLRLKESEGNELNDDIVFLATQLKVNEMVLLSKQTNIEEQTIKLNGFTNMSSFEWLIENKLTPLKRENILVVSEKSNFSISRNPGVTTDKPLPVNVNTPSGLVYRVQIGAFRKPIPNEAFREFSPVSGDLLANGLTCYMAGYFNSSTTAVSARKEIRSLGYSDAFIVAYCDGKRISFAQGREFEISGRCKTLSTNELNIALQQNNIIPSNNNSSENLAQSNSIESQNNQIISKENKSVNSRAEVGERYKNLFFTVQVGAYNKPIGENQLQGIQDLISFKTDKGQIRYSSGRFDNVNDAKARKKEAVAKGVTDAFVVAYFEGKRISMAEATNLLAQYGTVILKPNIEPSESDVAVVSSSGTRYIEIQMELPDVVKKIDNDSVILYSLDCKPEEATLILERMNRVGVFTYQPEQQRILSSRMKVKDLTNVQKDYLKDFTVIQNSTDSSLFVELDITDKIRSGSFSDWLLRCRYNYEIQNRNEQISLMIFPENDFQRVDILKKASELLISIKN